MGKSVTGLTKERARYIEQRLVEGDPAQALLDTVGNHPANLIVVGNRGLGASQGQLLGSVPRQRGQERGLRRTGRPDLGPRRGSHVPGRPGRVRRQLGKREVVMSGNRAVAYQGPGVVEVVDIDYPTFELKDGPGVNPANVGRKLPHAVVLKTVATNICGSDQHMVRGRTTAPTGLVLGHEITGEVVEAGPGVEFVKVGDLVSVPFNISCGRCRNCKTGKTGICLNVNPDRPGSAYGYVDMGGWVGGQAEYVLVPYADWNAPGLPGQGPGDGEDPGPGAAVGHLPDRLPRRGHRRRRGRLDGVRGRGRPGRPGRGGRGPAARRGRGDRGRPQRGPSGPGPPVRLRDDRRRSRTDPGPAGADPRRTEVDAAIDAVGFEARGHGGGADAPEAPATVLNSLMELTAAGGAIGIPGLYVTGDPGGIDEAAKVGALSLSLGTGWAKSLSSPPASAR